MSGDDARSAHPPPGTDAAAMHLGARIRALRRERRLTLKALGRLAGLSHPFLSQVERGLARPSVESMTRIATVLEVPVAELWAPPRAAERVRLLRRDEGAPDRYGFRTIPGDPVLREWSARDRRWPERYEVLGGAVALYVARGAIDVDLDGEVLELSEGDTLRFDGAVPHRLRRSGGSNTRALMIVAL
jgi:transcriptional regulator with XRE-family HTH domain